MKTKTPKGIVSFIFMTLLLTGLALTVITVTNCGEKASINPDNMVAQLLKTMNKYPDLSIKANPAKATVKKEKNNHYTIVLKDTSMNISFSGVLTFFKRSGLGGPYDTLLVHPLTAKRMVLTYDPEKKYLALKETAGVHLQLEFNREGEKNKTKKFSGFEKATLKVKHISFNSLDISHLLKPFDKHILVKDRQTRQKPDEKNDSRVQGINFILEGRTHNGKKLSLDLNMDTAKLSNFWDSITETSINDYLFSIRETPPNIKKIREQGKSIMDGGSEINQLSFKLDIQDQQPVHGTIEKFTMKTEMKPNPKRTAFDCAYILELSGIKLSSPGNKIVQWIGHIDRFRFGIGLDDLNDQAITSLLDFLKKIINYRDSSDHNQMARHISAMSFKLIMDLINSNPTVKFFIKPVKHKDGDVFMQYTFKLRNLLNPEITFSLGVTQPEIFFQRMKEANAFPPIVPDQLLNMFQIHGIKQSDGYTAVSRTFTGKDISQLAKQKGQPVIPFSP